MPVVSLEFDCTAKHRTAPEDVGAWGVPLTARPTWGFHPSQGIRLPQRKGGVCRAATSDPSPVVAQLWGLSLTFRGDRTKGPRLGWRCRPRRGRHCWGCRDSTKSFSVRPGRRIALPELPEQCSVSPRGTLLRSPAQGQEGEGRLVCGAGPWRLLCLPARVSGFASSHHPPSSTKCTLSRRTEFFVCLPGRL